VDRNNAEANEKDCSSAAISDASFNERLDCRPIFRNSRGEHGYQVSGRNYQAEALDGAPPLRHATGTSRRFAGEKTMESFACGIVNLIGFQLVVGFMFSIYLAPLIIAVVRGHHRWAWVGFLNVALGWTVAGWIAALVWSVTATGQPEAIMRFGSTALGAPQPAVA
jgi:hypothetical protein